MKNDVHMRIIISRGLRSTPYQSEKVVVSNPSIIIIPEYKKPNVKIYKKGLRLVTVSTIRGNLNAQNPQINSLSKLNCIIACIEGHKKGGDESLMFDINGNIATNNSTHFFYIKNNSVYTSKGKYQVTGITRQKIRSSIPFLIERGIKKIYVELFKADFEENERKPVIIGITGTNYDRLTSVSYTHLTLPTM